MLNIKNTMYSYMELKRIQRHKNFKIKIRELCDSEILYSVDADDFTIVFNLLRKDTILGEYHEIYFKMLKEISNDTQNEDVIQNIQNKMIEHHQKCRKIFNYTKKQCQEWLLRIDDIFLLENLLLSFHTELKTTLQKELIPYFKECIERQNGYAELVINASNSHIQGGGILPLRTFIFAFKDSVSLLNLKDEFMFHKTNQEWEIPLSVSLEVIINIYKSNTFRNKKMPDVSWALEFFTHNNIKYISRITPFKFQSFQKHMLEFEKVLCELKINKKDICIVGSGVLDILGIRESNDFDCILNYNARTSFGMNSLKLCKDIELVHVDWCSTNGQIDYSDEDIIYDENLHFTWHDIKFANLDLVKIVKQHQLREKDKADILLINEFLSEKYES